MARRTDPDETLDVDAIDAAIDAIDEAQENTLDDVRDAAAFDISDARNLIRHHDARLRAKNLLLAHGIRRFGVPAWMRERGLTVEDLEETRAAEREFLTKLVDEIEEEL